MTSAVLIAEGAAEFFAPTSTDMVDTLVADYRRERSCIEGVDAFLRGDGFHAALGYYIEGNREELYGLRSTPATDKLFRVDGAIKALNAAHWNKALRLTDVLDYMPAKRREEWFSQIEKMETPDFEEETVRATLGSLLAQRMDFLAEKVDGIFRALSRSHVTNRPEGFSKRLILTGITNDYGGYARAQTGHINDLRQIIAKFMGRDEPGYSASNRLVEIARAYHRGEWLDVDGGALRVRCYLNGNAHVEIHPDIAWRLNQILAHLYPAAIPSQFRSEPKKTAKVREHTLMECPLPFAVLGLLDQMADVQTSPRKDRWGEIISQPLTTNTCSLEFPYGDHGKHVVQEACRVLEAIGGVQMRNGKGRAWWEFDYPPRAVIRGIVVAGCIPDHKSHQFYPTPPALARRVIELAEIGPDDECLEPSAGTGGLADYLPKDRTQCVEVSPLHCKVLASKGHQVVERDFLVWQAPQKFTRVAMNPPFSGGRWQAHLERAATMLAPSGRLVAILPASANGKALLPGYTLTFDGPHDNAFAGTSVSVVIVVAERAA